MFCTYIELTQYFSISVDVCIVSPF